MATIVEMINPLTGLPEQVDKLDHTAQEIDDAVDLTPKLSNPNLVDNPYFGNPVNQRGQTRYTDTGYTIDRWALSSSTPGSFLLHGSDNYSADVKGVFFQRIENKRFIVGAKYTLSVLRGLIASPTLYHETFTLTASVGWKSRFNVNGGTFGFYHDSNASDIQFDLDGDKTIIAVKLELGSQQTLAHKENGVWVLNEIPDYADMLARCQRYCFVWDYGVANTACLAVLQAYSTTNAFGIIPTPVTMREKPVISGGVLTAGGKTVILSGIVKCANGIRAIASVSNGDLTVGQAVAIENGNDNDRVIFSADL